MGQDNQDEPVLSEVLRPDRLPPQGPVAEAGPAMRDDDATVRAGASDGVADTAKLLVPPPTSAVRRAFLARHAVSELEMAAQYLAHLLDAAERGGGTAAEALRRASLLTQKAIAELRRAGLTELGRQTR